MKKVLTIVLSVAMVICLMPAMAFAADATTTADNTTKATGLAQFSDADSITNKEAVSVLTGLHIINGMGDGTFQPKGDVTRAQTATMISILVRGGDTSSLKAPSQDPFTDVAKDNWAAPYVAYGAQQGYINGMGDGTYAPNNNVTTAQLATILDQILGYSKADVAYQWPENAMAKANEAGLLVNVNKSANDNLDREEAAQMIFNALKATDVVKDTTTGTNGSTLYKPVKNDSKLDYQGTDDETEQLVEKLFPKATYKPEAKDEFGRTATAWKNGRDKISDDVVAKPAYTYTSKQEAKDLKADLKGYDIDAEEIVNGAAAKNLTSVKDIADETGNGVLVELYANDKDTAITKAVVADYVLDEVAGVNSQTGTITLKANGEITKDATFYDALSSVAKKDKVLVAVGHDGVIDAYIPTKVTGPVTATTTKPVSATVNGTKYEAAKTNSIVKLAVDSSKDVDLYLDKYNYIKGNPDADNTVVSEWILVTAAYATSDKYGKTVDYVQGVNEKGEAVEDLKISDKSPVPAAELKQYAPQMKMLLAYKETPDGYEFARVGENSERHADLTANKTVKAGANNIANVLVSSDVKTIDVSGSGSDLKVTSVNGLQALTAGQYVYVTKTINKTNVVTTVYRFKDAESSTVLISAITGAASFKNADGKDDKGVTVEYYTKDSAEPQTATVKGSDVTEKNINKFFEFTTEGEGFTARLADKQGVTDTAIDSANAQGIVLEGTAYSIKDDAAVRDLRDKDKIAEAGNTNNVQKIATVADLVDAVADNNVAVTFKADEQNVISEIYVTDVTAKDYVAPTK
ncbi:MAG: S-layer homology domain-containing protein [Anaerovoracaceae bacterium]|nr:S-layer homology domain-containing protein [Bacillota bacterium]MDY2670562.1 S-layer homology domain-containing protein [Anaerovoracaceae bacterium]